MTVAYVGLYARS